ncbi:MAG TPA: M2 family metallopeptidase [Anaeromyxobacter sp.]
MTNCCLEPWPDAMEVLAGQRKADASALLEHHAPLRARLREQNAGQRCGWRPGRRSRTPGLGVAPRAA